MVFLLLLLFVLFLLSCGSTAAHLVSLMLQTIAPKISFARMVIVPCLVLRQLICHTFFTLLLFVNATVAADRFAHEGTPGQYPVCTSSRYFQHARGVARRLVALVSHGCHSAWKKLSLRVSLAIIAFALLSLSVGRVLFPPLACPPHFAQDFPRAMPTNGERSVAFVALGILFAAALLSVRSTKPFNFSRWGWCGFFLLHPIVLLGGTLGVVIACWVCCLLHVINIIGDRFAMLLPSSFAGRCALQVIRCFFLRLGTSSEPRSLRCVQGRKARRSQHLLVETENKKLRRLSKQLSKAGWL